MTSYEIIPILQSVSLSSETAGTNIFLIFKYELLKKKFLFLRQIFGNGSDLFLQCIERKFYFFVYFLGYNEKLYLFYIIFIINCLIYLYFCVLNNNKNNNKQFAVLGRRTTVFLRSQAINKFRPEILKGCSIVYYRAYTKIS